MLVKMIVKLLLVVSAVTVLNSSAVFACSSDDCRVDVSACSDDDCCNDVSVCSNDNSYTAVIDLMFEGLNLTNEGNYAMALEKFLQARDISDVQVVNYFIGLSYYKLDEKEKSVEFFDKTIDLWLTVDHDTDKYYVSHAYHHKMLVDFQSGRYILSLKNCWLAIYYWF